MRGDPVPRPSGCAGSPRLAGNESAAELLLGAEIANLGRIMTNDTITAVPGMQVGHARDEEARTGCTVLLGPFRGSAHVLGFATGTRELDLLQPEALASQVDALLLTGGSAFGLGAANGVVEWLEEQGRGFDAGVTRVPLVPAAVIFDLAEGRADVRPDAAMGRSACESASADPVEQGRVGAGTGATVGKLLGPASASPGGIGSAASRLRMMNAPAGDEGVHTVGALVVVNALGDVLDPENRIVAGARDETGNFVDTARRLREGSVAGFSPRPGTNTTLAVIATDAPLSRVQLHSLARLAASALARRISPVFTPFDGDIVFVLSTAPTVRDVAAPELLRLGTVAQEALERAIIKAVAR